MLTNAAPGWNTPPATGDGRRRRTVAMLVAGQSPAAKVKPTRGEAGYAVSTSDRASTHQHSPHAATPLQYRRWTTARARGLRATHYPRTVPRMAYKSVTVRLDERTIATIDSLIEPMRQQMRTGGWIPIEGKPTRSDMIRTFIAGWLTDHHETVDGMLDSSVTRTVTDLTGIRNYGSDRDS